MERRPGTPSLLRELNDRAALDLLLPGIPLTRTQISEQTRVSKVTVAQMLARLEERGLVAGSASRRAVAVRTRRSTPSCPRAPMSPGSTSRWTASPAGFADVTGRVVAEVSVPQRRGQPGRAGPRGGRPGLPHGRGGDEPVSAFVIGSPGVVDPHTGDPSLAINLPDWHEGILGSLRGALNRPVIIENDVNLAAMAERARGAARGLDDFALVWIGVGLGMAAFLGGKLHRGAAARLGGSVTCR